MRMDTYHAEETDQMEGGRMRYYTFSAEGALWAIGNTREGETIDGLVKRLRKLSARGISAMPPFIFMGGVLYGPEVTGR